MNHDVVGGVRRNWRVYLDVRGQRAADTGKETRELVQDIYQCSALSAMVAMAGKTDGMRLVDGSVRFGPAGVHITGDRYRSMGDETVLDG